MAITFEGIVGAGTDSTVVLTADVPAATPGVAYFLAIVGACDQYSARGVDTFITVTDEGVFSTKYGCFRTSNFWTGGTGNGIYARCPNLFSDPAMTPNMAAYLFAAAVLYKLPAGSAITLAGAPAGAQWSALLFKGIDGGTGFVIPRASLPPDGFASGVFPGAQLAGGSYPSFLRVEDVISPGGGTFDTYGSWGSEVDGASVTSIGDGLLLGALNAVGVAIPGGPLSSPQYEALSLPAPAWAFCVPLVTFTGTTTFSWTAGGAGSITVPWRIDWGYRLEPAGTYDISWAYYAPSSLGSYTGTTIINPVGPVTDTQTIWVSQSPEQAANAGIAEIHEGAGVDYCPGIPRFSSVVRLDDALDGAGAAPILQPGPRFQSRIPILSP